MKIRVEAFWDDTARVWVASSLEPLGLVTEAATVEALQRKIEIMVPDFFSEFGEAFEIELVTRSHHTVAAA